MSAVSGSETEQALAAQGAKPLAVPRRLLRMRSDAALAERFALGDEAAFDVIYERHRPVVLAVCMGVLGTPPDAEDATQETFSALAVALRSRPPAELRPWLIRVARNASIDTTRRRRHRLLTLDGEIPEIAARPAGGGQAELAVVLDGIRELPEGQRMALLMRELGGHSYAEIAEFLATDEEAVKGLIARARVGLRTYREATELSCATARDTISAEPDGRRYDKTIRRHLRGCASCRGYRDALRDDAKALRAALPIQAGTVATGSLSSGGMFSAAKGSLLGYGLTQAATTCAASACAVGAIGGMVFVAPVHRLGLQPILPSAKSAGVHRHAAVKAPSHSTAVPGVSHAAITVSHRTPTAPSTPATTTGHHAITHGSAARHRHHVKVTKVSLPLLPRHHKHGPAATNNQATPAVPATTSVTTQTTVVQSVTPATQSTLSQATPTQATQNSPSSAGQAAPTGSTQSSPGAGTQSGDPQSGHGHGGGLHSGGATVSTGGSTTTSTTTTPTTTDTTPTTTSPTTTTTTPTTTTPTTTGTTPTTTTPTTTTSPSTTPVGYGGGHGHSGGGQSGSRHGGNSHPTTTTPSATTTASSTTTTATTATTATTTTVTPSSTTAATSNRSSGWDHGSGTHGNHTWTH
jgi:RNA polymerase sigma factor (sigma-70 family)